MPSHRRPNYPKPIRKAIANLEANLKYQGIIAESIKNNGEFPSDIKERIPDFSIEERIPLDDDVESSQQPQCYHGPNVVQSIKLEPYKVNNFSLNVIPIENDISNVLANVPIEIASNGTEFYSAEMGINSIGTMDSLSSYTVYIQGNSEITIDIVGCLIDVDTVRYNLPPNFMTYMSYTGNLPFPAEDFFSTIANEILIVSDDNGNYYIPQFGINSIDTAGGMQPGKGYLIYLSSQSTVTFEPPREIMDYNINVPTLPIENINGDDSCFYDNLTNMQHVQYGMVSPWGYGIGGEFCMDYFEDYPDLWRLDVSEGGNNLWGFGIFSLTQTFGNTNSLPNNWRQYCADAFGNEDPASILGNGQSKCGVPGPDATCTSPYFCQPIPTGTCRAIAANSSFSQGEPGGIAYMCDPSPSDEALGVFDSDVYYVSSLCSKTCNFYATKVNNITYNYDNCMQRNLLDPIDIRGGPITRTTPIEDLPCDCTGRRYLYDDGSGNLICAYPPELNPPDEDDTDDTDDDTDDSDYGMIPVEIYGCTYYNAINYNPDATIDDGSCRFVFTPDDNTDDGDTIIPDIPEIVGCTDYRACNFNPRATLSNPRLCEYPISCPDGMNTVCPPETCPETIDPTEIDPIQDLPELIQINNIIINDRDVSFDVTIIDYDNFRDANQVLNVHWGDGMFQSSYDNLFGEGPFRLSHTYDRYGDFNISLTLINDGSQINDYVVFQVNITEFLPDISDIIVVRNVLTRERRVDLTYEYLDFNTEGAGRNIPIKINWGEVVENSDVIDTPVNTPTTVSHIYPNYGNFRINLSSNLNTNISTFWDVQLEESVLPEPDDIYGCTDENAINHNPDATFDDGSCQYDFSENIAIQNIEVDSINKKVKIDLFASGVDDIVDEQFVMVLQGPIDGSNIDTNVNISITENEIAEYEIEFDDYGEYQLIFLLNNSSQTNTIDDLITSVTISPPAEPEYVEGCTDPNAINYDADATLDDGSCEYLEGCTDPNAINYDADATVDDGSCQYDFSENISIVELIVNPENKKVNITLTADSNDDVSNEQLVLSLLPVDGSDVTNTEYEVFTEGEEVTFEINFDDYGEYNLEFGLIHSENLNETIDTLNTTIIIPQPIVQEDFVRINGLSILQSPPRTVQLDFTYVDSFYEEGNEDATRRVTINYNDGTVIEQLVDVNTEIQAAVHQYSQYGSKRIIITALDSNQSTEISFNLVEPIEEEIPVPIEFEGDYILGGDFNYIANTLPPVTDVLMCTSTFMDGSSADSECLGQAEGNGCALEFGFYFGECRPYPTLRTFYASIYETCEDTEPVSQGVADSFLINSQLRTFQFDENGPIPNQASSDLPPFSSLTYLQSGTGLLFKPQQGNNFCLKFTQPEPIYD